MPAGADGETLLNALLVASLHTDVFRHGQLGCLKYSPKQQKIFFYKTTAAIRGFRRRGRNRYQQYSGAQVWARKKSFSQQLQYALFLSKDLETLLTLASIYLTMVIWVASNLFLHLSLSMWDLFVRRDGKDYKQNATPWLFFFLSYLGDIISPRHQYHWLLIHSLAFSKSKATRRKIKSGGIDKCPW